MSVTFAAVQLSSQADLSENLSRACARVREARDRGADVVLLPENFAFIGEEEASRASIAEDLDAGSGPIAKAISSVAREAGVYVVAGGLPEKSDSPARPFNTCAVYSDEGALVARYRKIHLFDVDLQRSGGGGLYRESACTAPGCEPVVVEMAGVRVGLSICYDLRFPELYRALAKQGAEVMVVPAAFTLATGKDHWQVLLRARAIESQCYVVAAGQWGKHPRGRQTFGKSCIVDPWGEIIAQAHEGEGLAIARLDRAYLEHVRAALPALTHTKLC